MFPDPNGSGQASSALRSSVERKQGSWMNSAGFEIPWILAETASKAFAWLESNFGVFRLDQKTVRAVNS